MKRAGALVGRRAPFPLLLPLLPLLLLLGLGGAMAQGQYTTVEIVVKDKKFVPAEVKAPANARIVIQVKNQDAVAMEFESKSLKLEKVVAPNSEGLVRVGPLKPGKYEFFDDFNMSNRGTLIVE
jgi:cupredoxin-like protein